MNLIHSAPQGHENGIFFQFQFFPSFTTGTAGTCPNQLFIFKLEWKRERERVKGRRGRRNGRRRKGGRREKNKTKIFQCSVMFIPVLSSYLIAGKPWWLSGKESACNAEETGDVGDAGWIPELERSPGE